MIQVKVKRPQRLKCSAAREAAVRQQALFKCARTHLPSPYFMLLSAIRALIAKGVSGGVRNLGLRRPSNVGSVPSDSLNLKDRPSIICPGAPPPASPNSDPRSLHPWSARRRVVLSQGLRSVSSGANSPMPVRRTGTRPNHVNWSKRYLRLGTESRLLHLTLWCRWRTGPRAACTLDEQPRPSTRDNLVSLRPSRRGSASATAASSPNASEWCSAQPRVRDAQPEVGLNDTRIVAASTLNAVPRSCGPAVRCRTSRETRRRRLESALGTTPGPRSARSRGAVRPKAPPALQPIPDWPAFPAVPLRSTCPAIVAAKRHVSVVVVRSRIPMEVGVMSGPARTRSRARIDRQDERERQTPATSLGDWVGAVPASRTGLRSGICVRRPPKAVVARLAPVVVKTEKNEDRRKRVPAASSPEVEGAYPHPRERAGPGRAPHPRGCRPAARRTTAKPLGLTG